ncbi:MAG TPA: hypothetical protein VNL15_02345 [Dehalococcoidia bacterium]|nr:hypothetical protein [Dehalococcoidia bacterium]
MAELEQDEKTSQEALRRMTKNKGRRKSRFIYATADNLPRIQILTKLPGQLIKSHCFVSVYYNARKRLRVFAAIDSSR